MALIDYRCNECDHVAEVLVYPHWDDPSCPECGSTDLTRVWRKMPGVIMRPDGYSLRPGEKGFGWDGLPKTDKEHYKWQWQ